MPNAAKILGSRGLCAAAALAMTCLAPTMAQAIGFDALEPRCDGVNQDVKAPKFDLAFFKDAKVWASSSGTTGVYFLEKKKTVKGELKTETYVVKFEPKLDAGVTVSRRFLQTYKVPHDRLLVEYTDATNIRSLFDGIADVRRARRIDADKAAKFDARFAALAELFKSKDTAPQKVIVTQFLPSLAGASSFGDALSPDNDARMQTLAGKAAAQMRFMKALDALNMPHNQKLLGYLFMMDAFLGNGDRLLGPDKNLANIFMAAGDDGTPCLVAIDNEAHAPAGAYLATVNYADKLNSQPIPQDRPHKSPKLSMTASDYLSAVLGRYKDGVTYKNSVGPLWAFNGAFLGRVAAADKVARRETCDPVDRLVTNVSFPMWIRRMFRAEFVNIINGMAGPIEGVSVVNLGHNGRMAVANPQADGFQSVCYNDITVNYIDEDGDPMQFSVRIDWLSFDQYFAEGAGLASRDLADVAAMKKAIATALKGMPTKNTDLVASALEARSQFFANVRAGEDPDSIIDTMLVANKKEAYAKAVSVSATTFTYVGDHWEPK
jgi:hypothetical protein